MCINCCILCSFVLITSLPRCSSLSFSIPTSTIGPANRLHASRKRKLHDKSIPNVILQNPSFAEDSKMYQDLLEMERRLDWTMMRKRMEVQDALGRVPTVSGFFLANGKGKLGKVDS